ncbi:hypothetical protein AALP_AA6G010700 [Arabis alpina]|uniref:Uncharacterized protein n=1 Tax=Arabis alpina TaxID=50452 RepID=A0A087GLA7_ARAAL|nr:hypothetical protein AALP_AA6G010700 [Arabis alpina]
MMAYSLIPMFVLPPFSSAPTNQSTRHIIIVYRRWISGLDSVLTYLCLLNARLDQSSSLRFTLDLMCRWLGSAVDEIGSSILAVLALIPSTVETTPYIRVNYSSISVAGLNS